MPRQLLRNSLSQGWTRDIARAIAQESSKEVKNALDTYVKSLGRPRAVIGPRLAQVNAEAGLHGLAAMSQAYESRPRKRDIPSYRPGSRYSFGQLSRALGSGVNVRTTRTTLSFLDQEWMDQQAPQWYRMSFGAGIPSGYQVRPMKHPINGRQLTGSPTLSMPPSAPFALPGNLRGSWRVKKGFEIHVSKNSKGAPPRSGLTISPTNFVQEGVSAINDVYPGLLLNVVREYLKPSTQVKIRV